MPAPKLSSEQRRVIRDVLAEADDFGASPMERLAAIETIGVEANYSNPDYGDRDSLGPFQQRPSQGWGTPAQVRNVRKATRTFLERARAARQSGSYKRAGDLAADVQRPAEQYRGRYHARRGEAKAILAEFDRGRAPAGAAGDGGVRQGGSTLGSALNGPANEFDSTRGMVSPLELAPQPQPVQVSAPAPPEATAQAVTGGPLELQAPLSGSPQSLKPQEPEAQQQLPDYSQEFGGQQAQQGGQQAPAGPVLMVGDSLGVGTSKYLKGVVSDTKVGRPSGRAVSVLAKMLDANPDATRVIFDAGTNDGSARELERSVKQARQIAGADIDLIVPTVNGPRAKEKNAVLKRLASTGAITLVDWAGASQGRLAGDGIHASSRGYKDRAALLSEAIGVGQQREAGAPKPAGKPRLKIAAGANAAGRPMARELVSFLEGYSAAADREIVVGTGTNHSKYTTTGSVSNHYTGHGADIPATGKTLTQLGTDGLLYAARGKRVQWLRNDGKVTTVRVTAANARQLASAGGIFNIPKGKGRVQMIVNTHQGGDHTNHLHWGLS